MLCQNATHGDPCARLRQRDCQSRRPIRVHAPVAESLLNRLDGVVQLLAILVHQCDAMDAQGVLGLLIQLDGTARMS